jgi:ribosomal protein S12 methylthiotransferase
VKYYLHTLGCPKNVVDAEEMASRLIAAGDVPVARPEDADVLVLNTCGFIAPAREESLDTARALAGIKRAGQRLVVAGCLAEREPDAVRAVRGVDAVLGTKRLAEIGAACHDGVPERASPRALDLSDGWRRVAGGVSAYLKIADGCDHVCTFCTIPSFKGPLRSKPIALVLAEAELLVASGTKELVLVAQDTTDYGHDFRDGTRLATLLDALEARFADRDVWMRVMYGYPHHVDDALLDTMARCRSVVPYLDMPLQHAHRDTLRRMKRGGSAEWHLALIERIRAHVPAVTLRSTFIVGFPGESEPEFATLLEFLDAARIEHAGFFPYSRERGTPAGDDDAQVDDETKRDRLERAQRVQQRVGLAANRRVVGRPIAVLVERHDRRWAIGRSAREAPEVDGEVHVRSAGALPPIGAFVSATVDGAGATWLRATAS